MATVREELVLVDRFSASFGRYLDLMARAAASSRLTAESQARLEAAVERLASSAEEMSESVERAAAGQNNMNRSMRQGQNSASGLERRILGLARAYVSLRTAQSFVRLSDTMTQNIARLDRMNDGLQTTAELQDMIYQAAQRSRGAYQGTVDMVGKLGTLAGNAFNSSAELVAFAEQINKQFALAGTNTQGMQAAMLQLTQAMSSGTLRGEELNSILENAPTIAQSIARYMGVNTGKMRELAAEGKITAEVVKNAMFAAAEETNAAFEKIPLTFGQMWTMAGNAAVNSMRPALQKLNDLLNSELGQKAVNGLITSFELLGQIASGAVDMIAAGMQLLADNWEVVSSVLAGGALAVGAAMTAAAVATAVSWAMANWPMLLFIATVSAAIYIARQLGYTWEEIGGVIGGVLGLLYALAMTNFVVPTQNAFAMLANFIGNFLNDPVAAIKVLFLDMVTSVLGYFSALARGMEDLINKIPGMHVNLTSGIDGIYNNVKRTAQNVKDASGWKEYVKAWDYVDYSTSWNKGAAMGQKIGSALDNFNPGDLLSGFSSSPIDYAAMMDATGIPGKLDAISGDTAAIKRSVSLSEEDMKLLVDMSERRYINNINLTAQTPVITINGQNTGDFEADLHWLEEALTRILLEQSASHTDQSYRF